LGKKRFIACREELCTLQETTAQPLYGGRSWLVLRSGAYTPAERSSKRLASFAPRDRGDLKLVLVSPHVAAAAGTI
jgi:hypothetical protein